MCTDPYMDICIDMCIDMCVDTCGDMMPQVDIADKSHSSVAAHQGDGARACTCCECRMLSAKLDAVLELLHTRPATFAPSSGGELAAAPMHGTSSKTKKEWESRLSPLTSALADVSIFV